MIFSKEFLESSIYAYDIRSKEISIEEAVLLGKAFGTELSLLNKETVCVGYDRRALSKGLYEGFIEGLVSVGMKVFGLGRVGTPVVQYMSIQKKLDSAVEITASHNPIGYHGFKFFVDNFAFYGPSLQKLLYRCINKKFDLFEKGTFVEIECSEYLNMLNSIEITEKFKVGWDLLNGCGGDVFSKLNLPGKNIVINGDYKSDFGGWAPDPSCIERLDQIIEIETSGKIDFAFLIDGDADRTSLLYKGKIIPGDVFFSMLIYLDSIIFNKKRAIVWDDISSFVLKKWSALFSEGFISKTGHSNIQNLAIEKDAFIAGERSGHYMFKNNNYIDDGIYSSLVFLSYLEKSKLSLSELFAIVPKTFFKNRQNIYCNSYFDKIEKIDALKRYFHENNIYFTEFDGVKVFLKGGCLLVRPSNTEAVIRVLIEGFSEDGLSEIVSFVENVFKFLKL